MITLYLLEKTSYVPLNLVEIIKNPSQKKGAYQQFKTTICCFLQLASCIVKGE